MFKLLLFSVAVFAVFAYPGRFRNGRFSGRFSARQFASSRSMLSLMCAPENCTTVEMRDRIRNCMPDLAQRAWNLCENTCEGTVNREMRACLVEALANITTTEARVLFREVTNMERLQSCVGDEFNSTMSNCGLRSSERVRA